MRKAKTIIALSGVFFLLFSYLNVSAGTQTKSTQTTTKSVQTKTKSTQPAKKTVQTKTKSTQTSTKSAQTKSKLTKKSVKAEPVKIKDASVVTIGTQRWAVANLNVSTFRNGDSIPEAKSNKEWVSAGESGKPAWCYYNNDPAAGLKYGKLYNWYAVNDPRGLAPEGWTLASDADWSNLINSLGGSGTAGNKMKSTNGWIEGNNGSNEAGFNGLPGGYRVENGIFRNLGTIGIWWSTAETRPQTAIDHYLAQNSSISVSSSPKQRGESVRCIRK